MIHKLYYKPSIDGDNGYKIEILIDDIVKVDGEGEAVGIGLAVFGGEGIAEGAERSVGTPSDEFYADKPWRNE